MERKKKTKVECTPEEAEAVRLEVLRRFEEKPIIDRGKFIYRRRGKRRAIGQEERNPTVNIDGTGYLLRNLVWLVVKKQWPTGHAKRIHPDDGIAIGNLELMHPEMYEEKAPEPGNVRSAVCAMIFQERNAQIEKWGNQNHHPHLIWNAILVEEVGEVSKALLEGPVSQHRISPDMESLEEELVQVAAVAVAWLEKIQTEKVGA